jgi:hypothetical protein
MTMSLIDRLPQVRGRLTAGAPLAALTWLRVGGLGEYGLTVTPPDANSNVQRIFVPRAALEELTVVGVIGSPMRRPRKKRVLPAGQQAGLFGEADSE